ncbi:hypothetical protein [Rhodopila sp.]|uniref:hypothetical protein n=1 Tax=Rhodopila sp. TaxID=2480087 RepID=UPI003D106147
MNRRILLRAAALAPAASLMACATQAPSQLATDVTLIASGLTAAIAQIKQIPAVPSATVTQLDAYLAAVQADAAQVAGATSAPATSTVQQIAQVVQAVASTVLPLVPGGSVVEATVQAAVSLLPAVMAEIGVSGATAPMKFTPDQARLILAAAH